MKLYAKGFLDECNALAPGALATHLDKTEQEIQRMLREPEQIGIGAFLRICDLLERAPVAFIIDDTPSWKPNRYNL